MIFFTFKPIQNVVACRHYYSAYQPGEWEAEYDKFKRLCIGPADVKICLSDDNIAEQHNKHRKFSSAVSAHYRSFYLDKSIDGICHGKYHKCYAAVIQHIFIAVEKTDQLAAEYDHEEGVKHTYDYSDSDRYLDALFDSVMPFSTEILRNKGGNRCRHALHCLEKDMIDLVGGAPCRHRSRAESVDIGEHDGVGERNYRTLQSKRKTDSEYYRENRLIQYGTVQIKRLKFVGIIHQIYKYRCRNKL